MCIMTVSDLGVAQRLKQASRGCISSVVKKLQPVLSCGLTPEKLNQTFCIGIAVGVLPLVWGTSLICIIAARLFRLNHVALQSVNYLLWPAHLALLVPFFTLGTDLFSWGPPVHPQMFSSLTSNQGLSSLKILGWSTLKALAAWSITVLPASLFAYGVARAVQENVSRVARPPSGR
jgi:hypothetical protein